MADPATMAVVGMASSGAQGVLGFMGSKQQGKAGYQQGMYQAGVAQMNAQIAKQNADYARSAGEVEAENRGMRTRAQIGSTRAIQGGSGLDVNKGSSVQVRESIADIGAHDVDIVRNNAARKAYGYEVEAANATAQGKLFTAQAVNAKKAGDINAFSSLIGGASSVASKWQTANQYGFFKSIADNPRDVGSAVSWDGA